jgi:hypothetical protein
MLLLGVAAYLYFDKTILLIEKIILISVSVVLSVGCIIYASHCRLVTTPKGLEKYSFFPTRVYIPWDNISRVELQGLGEVNLVYLPKANDTEEKEIAISAFVNNWQEGGLASEINKYKPNIIVSDELSTRKETTFFYRTGSLLIYYPLSMILAFIPYTIIPTGFYEKFNTSWDNASNGFILAALGGIAGLLVYPAWRDKQTDLSTVRKVTFIYYIAPFSGFIMTFFLSLLFEAIPFFANFSLLYTIFGFLQLEILLRFIGLSYKAMLNNALKG